MQCQSSSRLQQFPTEKYRKLANSGLISENMGNPANPRYLFEKFQIFHLCTFKRSKSWCTYPLCMMDQHGLLHLPNLHDRHLVPHMNKTYQISNISPQGMYVIFKPKKYQTSTHLLELKNLKWQKRQVIILRFFSEKRDRVFQDSQNQLGTLLTFYIHALNSKTSIG